MTSGFIITDGNEFIGNGLVLSNGYALTNSHVLRDGGTHALINDEHIRFDVLKNFREPEYDFREENINEEVLDYAIIASDKFVFGNENFRTSPLERGEALSIVAFTKGESTLQWYSGSCNFPLEKFENTLSVYFQTNIKQPVKGNSGSPVVDSENNIVGLFFMFSRNLNSGYFIKMEYLIPKVLPYLNSLK